MTSLLNTLSIGLSVFTIYLKLKEISKDKELRQSLYEHMTPEQQKVWGEAFGVSSDKYDESVKPL